MGDQVTGILSRQDLLRGMKTEGPDVYIAGLMNRNFALVDPNMDLGEAIRLLHQSGPGPCALVMEGGKLLGILINESIPAFALRQFGFQR
jgi:predicted transcriptional regulator